MNIFRRKKHRPIWANNRITKKGKDDLAMLFETMMTKWMCIYLTNTKTEYEDLDQEAFADAAMCALMTKEFTETVLDTHNKLFEGM